MPFVIKQTDTYKSDFYFKEYAMGFNCWTGDLVDAKRFPTHTKALAYGRKAMVLPREDVSIEEVES